MIQPGNAGCPGGGYFAPVHPWGLVSLDWSSAHSVWFRGNTSNTTCEATSVTNCAQLKAAGLAHRCFIYHSARPNARGASVCRVRRPASPHARKR